MEGIHHSSCSLNCFDNCGFKVQVEGNQVVKIDGDPDHPVTKGKICARGRLLAEKTNSSQRITRPLKKVNGQFEPIEWELALAEIAAKMSELSAEYGPLSVLHSHDYANTGLLTNLDRRFFNHFGGVTELYGSTCWGAGIEAQMMDFGNSLSHAPDDIVNSRNVVIWGRNVARTNMHLFSRLKQSKANGASVIVIDPIYNATAKIASQYISIKPGMDFLLVVGIIKIIIANNWQDETFIAKYTVGFDDLLKMIETISLDDICQQTGVSLESIRNLAKIYADKPTCTYIGLGMQRYFNGGNTIRLIDALVALSGNVGVPGGGANFGNLQVGQSFNLDVLIDSDKVIASRAIPMVNQAEAILTLTNPPIKMAFVTCGNPVVQVPNSQLVEKAFKTLDMIVVMDHFMTDTAMMADYVLPVTTVFEVEDIYYSSMYHHYANYSPKIIDPPGMVKPDSWIWSELAKRLGFGHAFDYTREEFLALVLDASSLHADLTDFKKKHHIELPVSVVPWENHQFQTSSGKYEFTSTRGAEKGVESRLTLSYPKENKWSNPELATLYPYSLITMHPLRSNHSQMHVLLPSLQKIKIEISEDIAEKSQVKTNDIIRVWNSRGVIQGEAVISPTMHEGTINIDEGASKQFGGSVNLLTSSLQSDNGMGSTVYDCLVNLEKIDR